MKVLSKEQPWNILKKKKTTVTITLQPPRTIPTPPQNHPTTPQLPPGHHLNMVKHTRPQRTPPAKPQAPTKHNDAQRRHLCSLPKGRRIEVACVKLQKSRARTSSDLNEKQSYLSASINNNAAKIQNQQKYVKPQHETEKPQAWRNNDNFNYNKNPQPIP